MTTTHIPSPTSGGLMLSYQCTAECRHCMYFCSPRWGAEWMSEEDLTACLSQLVGRIQPSPWGPQAIGVNDGLHFSGGEPFLNFELLLRGVQIAEELGIPSTFVETNCFWCRSDEETRDRLQRLKAAGLKGIMISVNPFYAEYVPFERTECCIAQSVEVFDRNVIVYQLEYYRLFRELGIRGRISLEDFLMKVGPRSLAGRVEMFLMGRATRALRDLYPAYPAQRWLSRPCQPPILREWHNHFDNYGNVMAGYCGGISLGSWRELDRLVGEPLDLAERPVLDYLLQGDMGGLLRFAQELGYRESDEGYVSKCDLCLDIRQHLVSVGEFAELQPLQFYEQVRRA